MNLTQKKLKRIELAKTDLTYKKYTTINILTGEFQGYSFEDWSIILKIVTKL